MYIIKSGKAIYEIPEQYIRFAAMQKAYEHKKSIAIDTERDAVSFLQLLGLEVFKQK